MPINARYVGDVAVLSNVGRMMNDPRYFDAGREVRAMLDQGFRSFVIELQGVGQPGSPTLGLMMTMTRQIRKEGGEVVLARVSKDVEKFFEQMQMEEFWDVFRTVDEARRHLTRHDDPVREP